MALTVETIVKQLSDTGVLAASVLSDFLPPRHSATSADELIEELVQRNYLTEFQARQVAAGKSKSLILGGYTILDRIGAGGMGQVFKAEHRRMKRQVAIKMVRDDRTKDPEAVARFQREVEAAAKLRHPNIVAADDADEFNGVHFLVMEYIEGESLGDFVKKHGPVREADATDWILQAARGLEFAHKHGVVHRDVKPSNLLLTHDGTVKVLDLGLARVDSIGDVSVQTELTTPGAVMGTVDFMSPEQSLNSKHADARADIYSLGCTLYYLLTGATLYQGESVVEKIIAHREQPIPTLNTDRSHVSRGLEAIFRKMVAKSPQDRYQSASEVITDLEHLKAGNDQPTEAWRMPLNDTSTAHKTRKAAGLRRTGDRERKRSIQKFVVCSVALGLSLVACARFLAQKSDLPPPPAATLAGTEKGGIISLTEIKDAYPSTPESERKAVQWALSKGAKITYHLRGNRPQLIPLVDVADFPPNARGINISFLSADYISDDDLTILAPLEALSLINVSYSRITDEGVRKLAKFPELISIYLSHTRVTNEGVAALAKLRLYSLDVSHTKVDGNGLVHIRSNPTLSFLRLAGLQLRDEHLTILEDMRALKELTIDRNQFSVAAIESLKKALPNCKVIVIDPSNVVPPTGNAVK